MRGSINVPLGQKIIFFVLEAALCVAQSYAASSGIGEDVNFVSEEIALDTEKWMAAHLRGIIQLTSSKFVSPFLSCLEMACNGHFGL